MIEIFQNIREIYDFAKPCEELMPYIEFFSESSADKCDLHFEKGHSSVTMFQSWTPTFYINLSGAYLIDLDHIRYSIVEGMDIMVIRNGKVERHNRATDRIFTVKFNPGGLQAIMGLDQTKMLGEVINLNQILPNTLLTKMKQLLSFEQRMVLIQSYLLGQFAKQQRKDHYVKTVNEAIFDYTATGLRLSTTQVAERLFITSKTINRYFNQVVGLPPKSYFSMLRARMALTAYAKNKQLFDATAYGYFDAAHFYKDVVAFTGSKLSALS